MKNSFSRVNTLLGMDNVPSYQTGHSIFMELANKSFAVLGNAEVVSFRKTIAIAPRSMAAKPVL